MHILVCNAGVNKDGMIWKMTEEQWDHGHRDEPQGVFQLHPGRRAADEGTGSRGRSWTITSINGKRGKLGQANYAASKAGIIGLTKTCARDLGKFGVNVNASRRG